MELKLFLFGGFTAQRPDGSAVALSTRKAQALLTIMACRDGDPQPRERLMALLWSDRADTQARHSLSQTLTSIRHALGGTSILAMERDTVVLSPGSVDADVAKFLQLAASDALEDLRTPCEGVLKTYTRPFSRADHEALEAEDLRWTRWQSGRLVAYADEVTQAIQASDFKG